MKTEFVKELEVLINKHSMENGSSTPDFILAEFLSGCLSSWNTAVGMRSRWYGRESGNGLEHDQKQVDLAK